MTEAELIEAVKEIAEGLRSDLTESITKLDAKCNSIADSVAKMKSDAAKKRDVDDYGNDPDGAMLTAADRARSDSVGVDPRAFASLAETVAEMKRRQTRLPADRNAFADAQAKADTVMRTHNERADPPMPGETLVDYQIRLARRMQPHSAKWKGVELSLIAADSIAFGNALDAIRADCYEAGVNPTGLPEFQHREIVEESRGGHRITRFVGTGSIFKQMSRPVRYVSYIGTRSTQHL
jgi:hypothetical protein